MKVGDLIKVQVDVDPPKMAIVTKVVGAPKPYEHLFEVYFFDLYQVRRMYRYDFFEVVSRSRQPEL